MSSIVFSADLDTSKLEAGIKQSNRSIENWVQGIEKQASGIDNVMAKVGGAIGAYFSINALANLGKEVIAVRGQFQQLGIAFETMLGSKEKADKLMQEAIAFSQKTPFTLSDVATNIKQLMAMGIATENVMETMKSLGDVAAGVSVPISRIAINYGQVATLGKLQGRELRDFAMAGVPLIDELAKSFKKSKDEITAMITAGQIGFPDVEKAFKSMSSEGGKFFNLMEKQNLSVTGQISNLTDKWQVMLNEIGKSNEGIIYSGIGGLNNLVTNYQKVIDVVKGLVLVLGTAKVATMIVANEQKIQAATAILVGASTDKKVLAEARAIVMEERHAASMRKLNATLLTNPWVLITAAVAAFVYVGYKLVTYQTDLEKAISKTNLEIENEKDKVNDLFGALKAAKEGTDQWKTAREAIISQYGQYISKQDQELSNLTQITDAYNEVSRAIVNNVALRTRTETLESISAAYNKEIVDKQTDIIDKIQPKVGKERAAAIKYELKQLVENYKQGLPDAEKKINEYRQSLLKEMGLTDEFDAPKVFGGGVKISNQFIELREYVKKFKEDSDLANKSYEQFINKGVIEIQKPDAIIQLTTALEQRKKINDELIIAEEKLRQIENKPGKDPLKDIADQKAIIKALKEQLDIKDKEVYKNTQEQLDYQTETGRKIIANQLDIDQQILDIQKDSYQKQRAQADLDFKKRINDIAIQREDELKAYNENMGVVNPVTGIKEPAKYSKLPEDQEKQYTESAVYAAKTREHEIVVIKEKAAKEIRDIQDELIIGRLEGIKKEVAAIDKTYDDLIQNIKDKGIPNEEDLINKTNEARRADQKAIRLKYNIDELDSEEKFEQDKNKIRFSGYGQEEALMKANFETFKKYEEKKIALLRASGSEEDLKKANDLQSALNVAQSDLIYAADEKRKRNQKEILDGAIQLTSILSAQLGLSGDIGNILANTLNTYKKIKDGNYAGAIVDNLTSITSLIQPTNKLGEQLKILYADLLKFQKALSLSDQEGGKKKAYEDELAQLEKIMAAEDKAVLKAKKRLNSWSNFGTHPTEEVKAYDDAVAKYAETQQKYEDLKRGYLDFLVGGITRNTIADALIQGFEAGKTGVDDFATYMNDILRNAVMASFTDSLLQSPEMVDYMETLNKLMEDGITPEEAKILAQMQADMAIKNKATYDAMTAGLPITNTSLTQPGLTGQIQRSITEETGTELAGLFRRFADDARISRDYTLTGINHLIGIEKNTYNTVLRLDNAILELHTISMNTSATYGASSKL
jgi:tape measure domain-containing protein